MAKDNRENRRTNTWNVFLTAQTRQGNAQVDVLQKRYEEDTYSSGPRMHRRILCDVSRPTASLRFPRFREAPEVVLVNEKRFLSYQLGGELRSTQPGIRSKVVDGEVHCFADMFISANAQTNRPRQDRIPDAGAVFWLNPDGSRISLTPNE